MRDGLNEKSSRCGSLVVSNRADGVTLARKAVFPDETEVGVSFENRAGLLVPLRLRAGETGLIFLFGVGRDDFSHARLDLRVEERIVEIVGALRAGIVKNDVGPQAFPDAAARLPYTRSCESFG